jgi:hypothetical protein
VEEWLAIKEASLANRPESPPSYERPLAALDLFILEENREGDIDDVSTPSQSKYSSGLILVDLHSLKFIC